MNIRTLKIESGFKMLEKKTEYNLMIAEKAIKAHSKFLNEIDVRLTMEEMYGQLGLEEQEGLGNEMYKKLT